MNHDGNNDKKVSPNPRGTKNVLSDIHVLSIVILSLSWLAMEINLVRDKWPRTRVSCILYTINDKTHSLDA